MTYTAVTKCHPSAGGFALWQKPEREPGPAEVLVEVSAGGICGTDLEIWKWPDWLSGRMAGRLPLTVGHEFAGHVRQLGEGVSGFAVGDQVAVESHISCGHCLTCAGGRPQICENLSYVGIDIDGGLARYSVLPASVLRALPPGFPPDSAAMLEPFALAVRAVLCDGGVTGRSVLVTGLGPLGLMTMAVAGTSGASSVVGVESNPYRLRFAREYIERVGVGTVLDAADADIARTSRTLTGGRGVDVWLDFSGADAALALGVEQLAVGGSARLLGTSFGPVRFDLSVAVMKEISFRTLHGRDDEVWPTAIAMAADRAVDLPALVTHRLPLERYEEAFGLLLDGKACKVLIEISG